MTTNWVLAEESENFPLMYHWRLLPDTTPLPEELADIERAVAYWEGADQVRRRIEALEHSTASVALFWSTSRRTCTSGWALSLQKAMRPRTVLASWWRRSCKPGSPS